MQPANKFFEKIEEIGDGHTATSARLRKQLGVTLSPDAAQSDEFTLIYTGRADMYDMFDAVELRVQGPAASKSRQMVLLSVNRARCITMSEVTQRYGEGALSVPTPRQPADDPVYLVYVKPWGKISYGFPRDYSCLREVIIDIPSPLPVD